MALRVLDSASVASADAFVYATCSERDCNQKHNFPGDVPDDRATCSRCGGLVELQYRLVVSHTGVRGGGRGRLSPFYQLYRMFIHFGVRTYVNIYVLIRP